MSGAERYPYFAKYSQAEFDKLERESVHAKIAFLISFSIVLILSAAVAVAWLILTREVAESVFFALVAIGFGCSAFVRPFHESAISIQKRLEQMNEKFKREHEVERQLEYQERIASNAELQLGALMTMTKKLDDDSRKSAMQNFTFSGGATNVSISANNVGGNFIQQSEIGAQDNVALAAALSEIAAALRDAKNEEASKTFERLKKEISEGQDKVTIRALWKHLLDVVPDLVKLTAAVATFSKLFVG
jgi:hypothetical protein